MAKRFKSIFFIFLLSLIPTLAIWTPFIFRIEKFWGIPLSTDGMAGIVANFDGPLYIVVAKTLYNLEAINQDFSFDLPNEYFAAHFPLFPLLVKAFVILTKLFGSVSPFAGYPYAMLMATLFSSVLALYYFYKFIFSYNPKNAWWLTIIFALFPARWLIVRSVGSPEPLFMASIIASIYYFQNKKYLKSSLWGVVAQLTKSPGILLFMAFMATLAAQSFKQLAISKTKKFDHLVNWRAYPIVLIPLSLLGLFTFYNYTFGDFFAYFNSGDNIHLFFPPFQIFNYAAPWVGTFWLEEVIFVYLFGALGLLKLITVYRNAEPQDREKNAVVMWFVGIFFATTLFVSHRDIIRYSLPLVPFLLAGWNKFLSSKDFRIAFGLILIPIFLYSLTFISQNTMPISDWGPLL